MHLLQRNHITTRLLVGVFALLGLALAVPGTAAAGEGPLPTPLTGEEALQLDAYEMARIEGISPGDALERLQNQKRAEQLLDEVTLAAGDRLAGAWIGHDPEWTVHVRLTAGPRNDEVEGLVAAAALPTQLLYRPGPSRRQLIEQANELARAWARGRRGIDGVAADPRSGELVIHANASAGAAAALRATIPSSVSTPVRVERTAEPEVPTYRGGVATNTCTAGFGVRNSLGLSGLVYAGHCESTTKYATTPTGTAIYGLTVRGYAWNSNGDLRWAQTNFHGSTNTFYGASSTSPTTRIGTGTAYVGQLVCHRGKTSGDSCGYVTSTTYAPSWACNGMACNAVFVKVEDYSLANLKGDSGGPWFSGGYAYGVHSGGVVGEVGANAVFTPISRISSMGISLL